MFPTRRLLHIGGTPTSPRSEASPRVAKQQSYFWIPQTGRAAWLIIWTDDIVVEVRVRTRREATSCWSRGFTPHFGSRSARHSRSPRHWQGSPQESYPRHLVVPPALADHCELPRRPKGVTPKFLNLDHSAWWLTRFEPSDRTMETPKLKQRAKETQRLLRLARQGVGAGRIAAELGCYAGSVRRMGDRLSVCPSPVGHAAEPYSSTFWPMPSARTRR